MQPTINLLGLEKLNRRLFYNHPDPIYTFDLEGNFFTINDAVCRLTEYSREELIGESFKDLLHPDFLSLTLENFQKAILGEQQRYECAILTRSGKVIYLDITNDPLMVGDVVVGVFGIAKDITENKHRERELRKATEDLRLYNEDLEIFRRIIAHDLRSPITKIMGISRYLQMEDVPDDTVKEMVKYVTKMSEEMDHLIKDLNQVVSLKTRGCEAREWIYLPDLVKMGVNGLKEEMAKANATLIFELETEDKIFTTKILLLSIIKNLFSNAIKYRSAERELVITVCSQIINNHLCLSVSDNGMGMDLSKVSADLFKMFKRFHPAIEGKGLGLYLVREQTRMMNGYVEVESELGVGSVFKVFLPIN